MSQSEWDRTHQTGDIGACPACGKVSYLSRKVARASAREKHPGERMSAYRCHGNPGVWHFGHLADPVRRGAS